MSTILPSVAKLSENVIRILGCNPGPMTLQGTNTYLIGKGDRRILLDSGEEDNPEYISLLKKVLNENKITLQQILISHWHHDHIGGLKDLIKEFHLTCPVSKIAAINENAHEEPSLPSGYSYLKDGDVLKTDGATLRVVHTPGHTEDHMVLFLDEEQALFSADCILGEGTAVFEDLHAYMISLNKILSLKPCKIYPGHGPEVLDPSEKIKGYIAHRQQREQQILQALKENRPTFLTAKEIVCIVYVGLAENLMAAAAYNVGHHLNKLEKDKQIESTVDGNEKRYRIT